ncbi:hypothetical protein HY993_02635 [Candidatus Micrarchaeota archaeon]|nr:hypothetical protein [Candidatus Micrarchaeota archaeon]
MDEHIFREFKSVLARRGIKAGEGLNEALALFISRFREKPRKKLGLLDFKPIDLGKAGRHASREIDDVVYGG